MKRISLLIFTFFLILQLKAQDMAAFFISMPDQFIPQLEEAWRKDLIDLYLAGKTASLDNTMGGKSTLQKLTKDYMLLKYTERSAVEIKLLPLVNNTNVACVIKTVFGPAHDSRVEFYTTDWQPLPLNNLMEPATVENFLKKDIDHQSEAFWEGISKLDMELIQYKLDESKQILTATYTTPDYLNDEDSEKAKHVLNDTPIVYKWKFGRFEK